MLDSIGMTSGTVLTLLNVARLQHGLFVLNVSWKLGQIRRLDCVGCRSKWGQASNFAAEEEEDVLLSWSQSGTSRY
jgi:hypothetical protein